MANLETFLLGAILLLLALIVLYRLGRFPRRLYRWTIYVIGCLLGGIGANLMIYGWLGTLILTQSH